MLKDIVLRNEPRGLHGGVYYELDNPGATWKVAGAVGINALYEAIATNPAGQLKVDQIQAGYDVIEQGARAVDQFLDEGGWVRPGGEPEPFPIEGTTELLDELTEEKMLRLGVNVFRVGYGIDARPVDDKSKDELVVIRSGFAELLRFYVSERGFISGLKLLFAKGRGRNVELPQEVINGLTRVTNRLVTANSHLEKLPFPAVQVAKQAIVDRSQRLILGRG